jgi:hypothetical protein
MKKKSVGLLELEPAVFYCFLEKTPLSPLGVKCSHVANIAHGLLGRMPKNKFVLSIESWILTFFLKFKFHVVLHDVTFNTIAQIRH